MRRAVFALGFVCLLVTAEASAVDRYRGTMQMTIDYYDFCRGFGLLRYFGRGQYSIPVTITVNPPFAVAGVTEKNPFQLIIMPTNAAFTGEGALTVISAGKSFTTRGPVLLQFWQITRSKQRFSGALLRDGTAEGVAVSNHMYSLTTLVPCRPDFGTYSKPNPLLLRGTTLKGEFLNGKMTLTISGQSKDTTRRFFGTVTAVKQ